MKRMLKMWGWSTLVILVVAALLAGAGVASIGGTDHATIQIDGMPLHLADLDAGEWALAIGGTAVGLLVAAVVVPVAIAVPLMLAAVAIAGALMAAAGVLAIVFSPVILLVLLAWLIVRASRRRAPRPARTDLGATMPR